MPGVSSHEKIFIVSREGQKTSLNLTITSLNWQYLSLVGAVGPGGGAL